MHSLLPLSIAAESNPHLSMHHSTTVDIVFCVCVSLSLSPESSVEGDSDAAIFLRGEGGGENPRLKKRRLFNGPRQQTTSAAFSSDDDMGEEGDAPPAPVQDTMMLTVPPALLKVPKLETLSLSGAKEKGARIDELLTCFRDGYYFVSFWALDAYLLKKKAEAHHSLTLGGGGVWDHDLIAELCRQSCETAG